MKTQSIFLLKEGASREHGNSIQHCLISWRSVFAGLIVTMITYITLIVLGIGVGGTSASNLIQDSRDASGLATGAAVWIGISVLLSLTLGSYFAARISTFITGRIGAAHGLVISAIFFAFMIYGAGQTIGFAGEGLGNLIGLTRINSNTFVNNSTIQNIVEKALGGATLKSDPSTVSKEVINRLLQGNTESAKNYLSYQTGLSTAEIDTRFNRMEAEFKAALQTTGIKTANAVSSAAWTIFWIMLLGLVAAAFAGAGGTRTNYNEPLTDETITPQVGRQNEAG